MTYFAANQSNPTQQPAPSAFRVATRFASEQRRLFLLTMVISMAILFAGCASNQGHSSGRLARVTPKSFSDIKPNDIAVLVDLDSRVPATPNRSPDFQVGVYPVDHNAWKPVGGRLKMRPILLHGKKLDRTAGKKLRRLMTPRSGRLKLVYVLTDESKKEMVKIQQKLIALLKKYPPDSGKKGRLRLGADVRFLVGADPQAGKLTLQTWLQLSIAEGPFQLWQGRINELR